MKIKRTSACLLCVIFLVLSLCSCSREKSVLTINDSLEINEGIFNYYLNDALFSGNNYTDEQCVEYATNLCLQYVTVNTFCNMNHIKLSQNDKKTVAEQTNALWRYYGKYYENINVTKDDFFKIQQSESLKKSLCLSLYDKGGQKEISDGVLKTYFAQNFVSIKYFYHEIYNKLSENELNSLTSSQRQKYDDQVSSAEKNYETISDIATYVNSGVYTLDEAYMTVSGNVQSKVSLNSTVLKRDNNIFSTQVMDAIFAQPDNSAFLITDEDKSYVYFIYKQDILKENEKIFDKYRNQVLLAVSSDKINEDLKSQISSYSAVRHTKQVESSLKKIKNVKRENYIGTENYVF